MACISFAFLTVTLFMAATDGAPNGVKLNVKVPEECKGNGFCHIKPEGYEDMEHIINGLLPKNLISTSLADREGGGAVISPESDWHNCPTRNETSFPYLNKPENATKVDIIIQTKLLSQPVVSVSCALDKIKPKYDNDVEQQCFQDLGLGAFAMKTTCETTYLTRSLLVFDPEKKVIQPKKFEIPCCCSCKIQY